MNKKKQTKKSSQPKAKKAAKPKAKSKTPGGGGAKKRKAVESISDSAPKKISAMGHQVWARIENRGLVIYHKPPSTKEEPDPPVGFLGSVPAAAAKEGANVLQRDLMALGTVSGATAKKMWLHLMRATDPYYPILMEEEFQRLAECLRPEDAKAAAIVKAVKEKATKDEREKAGEVAAAKARDAANAAERLVFRYLYALEGMERHLVKLCAESTVPEIKDCISSRLRSFYDRINRDIYCRQKAFRKKEPMYSDLRSASKERFHVTQQDGWKRETLEEKTRVLAAQVTGKGQSPRSPSLAVKQWVHDRMRTLLELKDELVRFRNAQELDESPLAKEPSEEATKFAKQFPIHEWDWTGVSFPDFWKQWLDAHLCNCWTNKPPQGKKAQASIYRKSFPEVVASAAEFWICNLWGWEPRNCEPLFNEMCMAFFKVPNESQEAPEQPSSVNPWLIARQ